MQPRRDAALALASAGWAVFPVHHMTPEGLCSCGGHRGCKPGKHPAVAHGFRVATCDAEQVAAWWSQREWNIGIAVPPGVVVLDEDPRNGGGVSLAAIVAEHGAEELATLTASTGGGGTHRYFTVPTDVRWPKRAAPGLDLRGPGSYVLAAPSNHESGGAYAWRDLAVALAPAPGWLLALAKGHAEPPSAFDEGRDLEPATVASMVAAVAPFYTEGTRHALGVAVAGYLRNAGIREACALEVLEGAAGLTGGQVDAVAARVGWAYRAEHPAGASALPAALVTALDALVVDPWGERMGATLAAARSAPGGGGEQPLILRAQDAEGAVFVNEGPDLGGYQPCALGVVRQRLAELGLARPMIVGKKRETCADMVERLGVTYRETVKNFSAPKSAWDPEQRRLIVGHRCPAIAPVFDPAVDRWLRALVGVKAGPVWEWIAGTHQRHISRPATALVLVGEHSIGKTLVAYALARLWGDRASPVPLKAIVAQFNAAITGSPAVLDDECEALLANRVTTETFRAIVADRERMYEPKGLERRTLWGAQRFVLTTNDLAKLRFADAVGAGAVGAIAERLLLVECPPERTTAAQVALDGCRDSTGEIDFGRIGGHLRWIQETVAVPDARQRFIGVDPDRASTVRAALTATVEASADVFEVIRAALAGERAVEGVTRAPEGALWVRPEVLARVLSAGDPRCTAESVRRALGAFRRHGRTHLWVDGRAVRAWELDVERLGVVLDRGQG